MPPAAIQAMGVDNGWHHVAVPQQFLIVSDVIAAVQKVCGERIPAMRRIGLDDTGVSRGQAHRLLNRSLISVVPMNLAGAPIGRACGAGKTYHQPHRFGAPGCFQGTGQLDRPKALREIALMQSARLGDLFLQRRDQVLR